MRFFIGIVVFIAGIISAAGQKVTYNFTGEIRDSSGQEVLSGASLVVLELNRGVTSKIDGSFTMTLPEGNYTVVIQYAGYADQIYPLKLHKNVHAVISCIPQVSTQQEVVVTAPGEERNVREADMGKIGIDVENAKKLPSLMGEVDLLKTIQLLPGVQASGEGNTGMYVRGGGPDQNLVLLDDAVLYNTGHLFGFLSVFNADAIRSVTLYKGNMPANYGGRISSVVDFTMREGDLKKYKVQGGVGLIASRLTVEGPIKKDKSSFILSARRTYIDELTKPLVSKNGVRGVPYYFYDLNFKANYLFSEKNKLYLSLYTGRDELRLKLLDGRLDSHTAWGNNTATLKWHHVFNKKLLLNSSLIYNNYAFSSSAKFDYFETKVDSKISDIGGKAELEYYPGILHKIKTGLQYTFHTFTPRRTDASASGATFTASANPKKYAHEVGLYVTEDFDLTEKLKIVAGIRINFFQQVGPYDYISGKDTTTYKKFQPVVSFLNPEPRLGIRYTLNAVSSLKASFNVNNQYIHLVSLSGNALPFDIWVPSSKLIKPQKGWQYSLGYFRNLHNNNYEFSVEAYYKKLKNLIEYRQDYVPSVSGDIESEFVFGKGASYGMEFFLKKKYGKLQGWIGYTLARAQRTFPDINDGKTFPARYDRRHDISVVGTYEISKRWTLGTTFVFATGQAITMPERRYIIEGTVYNQYGPRNGFRMQPYNRLDISATYEKKRPDRKFESSWTFAIYNVYNRKNPYLYYIDASGDVTQGSLTVQAKKLYLFPILPSITWNFKW